jgi:hypothetical protein
VRQPVTKLDESTRTHSRFHNLLEYLQSIELGVAHREVSLHRRTCKMAQKGTFLLGAMGTSLYSLYTHCLSNIHKTCSLQSGNVVLTRRAPYFLCSAFPALVGAICRIRGRSSPVRAADEEFDAEPPSQFRFYRAYTAARCSASQPLQARSTVRGTSCSPLA